MINIKLAERILRLTKNRWEQDESDTITVNKHKSKKNNKTFFYRKLIAQCVSALKIEEELSGTIAKKISHFCEQNKKIIGDKLDFIFQFDSLPENIKMAVANKVALILPDLCGFSKEESKAYFAQLKRFKPVTVDSELPEKTITTMGKDHEVQAEHKAFSLLGFTIHHASIHNLDLTDCQLSRATFEDCSFNKTNFKDAKLVIAKFKNCTLNECNLKGTHLKGWRLEHSVVKKCSLQGAVHGLLPIASSIDSQAYQDVVKDNALAMSQLEQKNPHLASLVKQILQPIQAYIDKRCNGNYEEANDKRRCKMLFAHMCISEIIDVARVYLAQHIMLLEKQKCEKDAKGWLSDVYQDKYNQALFTAKIKSKFNFKRHFEVFLENLAIAQEAGAFANPSKPIELKVYQVKAEAKQEDKIQSDITTTTQGKSRSRSNSFESSVVPKNPFQQELANKLAIRNGSNSGNEQVLSQPAGTKSVLPQKTSYRKVNLTGGLNIFAPTMSKPVKPALEDDTDLSFGLTTEEATSPEELEYTG